MYLLMPHLRITPTLLLELELLGEGEGLGSSFRVRGRLWGQSPQAPSAPTMMTGAPALVLGVSGLGFRVTWTLFGERSSFGGCLNPNPRPIA